MEICVSHYNEDLLWMKDCEFPISIVTHYGPEAKPPEIPVKDQYVIMNVGREASAYLHYIIARYDTLPDKVAFIHGHESAWHQNSDRSFMDMIRNAQVDKFGYVPLNNHWRCVNTETQFKTFEAKWNEMFNMKLPDTFIVDSCGQFVVTRERILRNTREQYIELLSHIDRDEYAIILEHSWHYILGEKISLEPRKDYFDPPLKEILYFCASLPASSAELKFGFIGNADRIKHLNGPIVHVKTPEEYEYYRRRGTLFFRYTDDSPTVILENEDRNATCLVDTDETLLSYSNTAMCICLKHEELIRDKL